MNTIEAIAWVRSLTAFFNYPANCDIQKDSDALENSEKADEIINLLQRWETLKRVYSHRELKPFTIHHKPNKEYPITINGLTIKNCMDYVENMFPGGKNDNERQKTNSSMP